MSSRSDYIFEIWVSASPGNSTILNVRPGLQKCFGDLADNPILKRIVFLMRWSGCRKISNLSYSSPVSIVPSYFSEPMNYYDEIYFPQSEEEIMDLLQASPFLGIMPRPVVKNEDNEETRAMKVEEKVKKMEEQYSSLVLTQIEKTGTPEVNILSIKEFDKPSAQIHTDCWSSNLSNYFKITCQNTSLLNT